MAKKILTTPIQKSDLEGIKLGDVIYLTGHITTSRDMSHRRVIEEGKTLPVNIKDGAIFHAGPIIRTISDNEFEVVSVGPTTSMRMEQFEYDFVKATGVRLIVGKGGMGVETARACKEFGAIHCVFPAGNAVLAATEVEKVESANWCELGMCETLWTFKVHEFGPLIVSIDAEGNNYFEEQKIEYNKKKDEVLEEIYKHVDFIK